MFEDLIDCKPGPSRDDARENGNQHLGFRGLGLRWFLGLRNLRV